MKTTHILLAFLLFILPIACEKNSISPSGSVSKKEYSFTDFSKLEVSDAFDVIVEFSDVTEYIEIEANKNIHQHIVVEKNGNTLVIKLADKIDIKGEATLIAYISTPALKDYSASGASRIIVEDRIMEPSVNIELSGGSFFSALITVTTVTADLSGASNLDISGTSASYTVDASGASNILDFGFSADIFSANFSGGSTGSVTVKKEISIEASGASTLLYKGAAIIANQNLSGGSTLINQN